MPERFRTPLLMLAEGKSYRQIAEITMAKEELVISRVCWGKKILRDRLGNYL